jgi:hypothetical protein
MNAKHRKTLKSIFANPVSKSIDWKAIENLFLAIGVDCVEGRGSRVRFYKDNVVASFHRPHPAKEAKPYQVKDARKFLIQLGVTP